MEYFGNDYDYPIMPTKDTALLPSERRQYEEKIKEANKRADEVYGCVLRKVNGLVNRALYLTDHQKRKLLEDLLR